MTRQNLIRLAAFGSFALLAGAYTFQAFGYPPCAMCYWQRWPHFAAVAVGVAAALIPARVWPYLGALAAAITSGIGVYHSGVERDWWEGPTSCTGGGLDLTSDLLSTSGDRLIMCDQVSWELFSLSMASWNALFSAVLVLIWLSAARKQ
ncbi:MAG: disulfide bond formation protein B [Yoonia sp.]|nr:disulfide bond formation protein B [Yoonia sp.]MDG1862253.1 disulfide bond formation protein B [Yoonia sp.]